MKRMRKAAETSESEERPLRGPKARNLVWPKQHKKQKPFNSILGFPGEGPHRVKDFGDSVKCSECFLLKWRVSLNGDAGKCEKCKNVRKRRTEMMKCRVCA